MKLSFKATIFLLFIILSLGFSLRYYHFYTLPRHGATFDEFAWTWLGISLIQEHTPLSWSPHSHYKEREHLIYQGAPFWIVRPYLEHPPLFGLVAGGSALLNGAQDMYTINLHNMRKLSLGLGLASMVLVFMLANTLYGRNIALITTLLYATIPTMVIGSRIVQNENFLIPSWLLALLLIHRYLKTGKKRFRNVAAIIAGLLSLAKVPWLVVGVSLGMILSYKGKWRDAFFVGGVTIAIFSLFIVYGIYWDKDLFLSLWTLQLARYDISFAGFFSIFTNPLLVDRNYLDGWILFGWFAIFFLMRNVKEHFFILIPFLAYLVVYIFAIPDEPSHGWYRYPFYPFIVISTVLVLREEWKKISLLSLFFIFLVGLPLLSLVWENTFGFSYLIYRGFILSAVLPIIYFLWKKQSQRLPRIFLIIWFFIFVILNILSVIIYSE